MAISDLISHSPPTASPSTWTRWGFAACFKIWTQHSLGQKIKHLKVNPAQAEKSHHTDFSQAPGHGSWGAGPSAPDSQASSPLLCILWNHPVNPWSPAAGSGCGMQGTRASLELLHTWLYQGSFDCKRDRLTARGWLFSPINSSLCLYLQRQFRIKSSPFSPGSSMIPQSVY